MKRRRNGILLRGGVAGAICLTLAAVAPQVAAAEPTDGNRSEQRATDADDGTTNPAFATTSIEYANSLRTKGDGDLWPSCWADDGHLYTANGDGRGFSDEPWQDIVVNRLEGHPDQNNLRGERLSAGADVAPVWSNPENYNRKPTGMACVDGDGDGRDEIYLAVQDLSKGPTVWFDDAPAATVVVSRDYGRTWEHTDEPMFSDYRFTTVMFLDYGQSARHRSVLPDDDEGYVYAYGIDYNWRDSFGNAVPDPQKLYLARVPIDSITDRDTWQFFAGDDGDGQRHWSADLADRVPVLHDERRVYSDTRIERAIDDMTVISQGSVVYNAPLKRYLYTSWTEYTFEFYESATPWGPWKVFARKDFGGHPWFGGSTDDPSCPDPKHGGYSTTIPSKFISADGKDMWIQSNWWVGSQCGGHDYAFTMRRMHVEPPQPGPAVNPPAPEVNLARTLPGTTPIAKTAHFGHLEYLNDGVTVQNEDSFDWENKPQDHWGYTWPRQHTMDRVVYTTGKMFDDGGWFAKDLRVQVRKGSRWVDVPRLEVTPDYAHDASVGSQRSFTFRFPAVSGDGVRIVGVPGGDHFTSIAELEVYYDGRS